MIVSSISYAISKRFEKHSMDVKNLVKQGNVFTNNKDSNVLTTIDTSSVIISDYLTINQEENLQRLVDLISNSNQVVFAVVDEKKQLLGIVYFNDIREIIFNNYRVKYTLVKDIMTQPITTINPNDTMETVMNKFDASKMAFLPVINNGKYNGFISKSLVLEAYRTKLQSMNFE